MAHSTQSTTLVLVRHGETEWNRVKRIQGQIDIPLSAAGHEQANALAERVRRERRDHQAVAAADTLVTATTPALGSIEEIAATATVLAGHIDAVISSDLSRAMQTATPLATVLGLTVEPDERLRERHYGVFQGHDADAIRDQWPESHARWVSLDPDFGPETGESLRVFSARVVDALASIARRYPGKTVVCVAHGGVLDCAYRFAKSMPLEAPRAHLLLNASVNIIDWYPQTDPRADRAELVLWGDVSHLAEQVAARDDT